MPGIFQKFFSWLLKTDEQTSAPPSKPKAPTPAPAPPQPTAAPIPLATAALPPTPILKPSAPGPRAEILDCRSPNLPLDSASEPAAPTPAPKTAFASPPVRACTGRMPPEPEVTVDLHIGLDLGTSCSKIVIGDAYLDHCHGVDFDSAARNVSKYLFPTRFFEIGAQTSLAALPGAANRSNLKLRLMDAVERRDDTSEAETDLAIYIALLLNHTFSWFSRNAAANHRNRRCCWWLNVGFPAKRIEGNPRLAASYTRACNAAAHAVDSGKPLSRSLVQRCFDSHQSADTSLRIAPERIHLYPEIAAQLAGYASSPYRKDGPLLLLDVGAGTLDVSTLILHRLDGEQVCSFHFCEVVPLGAFRLYQETHQAVSSLAPGALLPLVSAGDDPAWLPPSSPRELFPPNAAVSRAVEAAFSAARAAFGDRCLDTCQANFARFKTYLDAPFAQSNRRPPAFKQRVNFILSGGGSRAQFYLDIYPARLEERLLNLTTWHPDREARHSREQGFHRIHFTQPENFRATGIGATDFDRLSVAHGLSMGVDTLMRITAKEVSDPGWRLTKDGSPPCRPLLGT